MSDVHPDDLLDRERRGRLSSDELRRLDEHSVGCAECRLERSLREDFAGERGALASEEESRLLARAIDRASLRGAGQSAALGANRPRWVGLGIAAAALAGIAAAAGIAGRSRTPSAPVERVEPSGVTVPENSAARVLPRISQSQAVPELPAPSAPPAPSVSARPNESAATLFARANAARRSGATEDALRAYRELAQRFPASREALTSRVAVGRLLLERTGDPSWALREFDAYLAAAPRGTLAEDALAGRALCLQRLGNGGAEQDAWRELLRRFPSTVHRARAERRLSSGAN